jgi:hypothetical protein
MPIDGARPVGENEAVVLTQLIREQGVPRRLI